MSVNVSCEISVYEVNGQEVKGAGLPKMKVKSHWSMPSKVLLQMGDHQCTVLASDLLTAVKNATNV
jgi:hypothetical protein